VPETVSPTLDQVLAFCAEDPVERVFLEDIARRGLGRFSAVTEDGGRDSWTSYRVVERLRGATVLEALLHTGRTHQIRVHFQHLGFPVLGDDTYGNRQSKHVMELTGYSAPRLMLHAQKLTFTHPRTGRKKTCEAPLPADFKEGLVALRLT